MKVKQENENITITFTESEIDCFFKTSLNKDTFETVWYSVDENGNMIRVFFNKE